MMKGKTYRVYLTADEKKRLEDIVSERIHPARQVRRARMLVHTANTNTTKNLAFTEYAVPDWPVPGGTCLFQL